MVRLIALDTASVRTHPDQPDLRLTELYLFGRWRPSARVPQLLDCAAATRADVTEATLADATSATWRPADAPLIDAACKEPAHDL